jgi:hypothetical protein
MSDIWTVVGPFYEHAQLGYVWGTVIWVGSGGDIEDNFSARGLLTAARGSDNGQPPLPAFKLEGQLNVPWSFGFQPMTLDVQYTPRPGTLASPCASMTTATCVRSPTRCHPSCPTSYMRQPAKASTGGTPQSASKQSRSPGWRARSR